MVLLNPLEVTMEPNATLASDETALLKRSQEGQPHALAALVGRYQQQVFGVVSCRGGCDRDAAYQLTVESFVDALRMEPSPGAPMLFHRLLRCVIEKTRDTQPSPVFEVPSIAGLAPEQQELLRLVRQGLLALPFDSRLLLLLRDQLGLPYEEIAALTARPPQQAKADTLAARRQLRERLRDIAGRAR